MLYWITQFSRKIIVICAAVILSLGTARVSLEYWFEMMITCWLLVVVQDNGHSLSLATNSTDPDALDSCIFRLCFNPSPFRAHGQHSSTFLYTKPSMWQACDASWYHTFDVFWVTGQRRLMVEVKYLGC